MIRMEKVCCEVPSVGGAKRGCKVVTSAGCGLGVIVRVASMYLKQQPLAPRLAHAGLGVVAAEL